MIRKPSDGLIEVSNAAAEGIKGFELLGILEGVDQYVSLQNFMIIDLYQQLHQGGGGMGIFHMPSDFFFRQLVDPPLLPNAVCFSHVLCSL